ncbi:GntR family transcriptional regulator [Musicola paradisiaca]|uniref:Transcriptional regulator, GntR family n=1 Tax=Musicola paradisiaca (strain Ech703) TaxID=579405 RepID=C6CCV3_MUSP7|nr:GntR family transcriptional regulator [Musicola paradisiaca]ACS84994.1 transcriptional regulator, GntR family [Musicola paradisiaca Ech703]
MLELEKAQRVSLTMQVEGKLKSALIVGALKPGARLVTKEIAEQLGTSITPVREALLRLASSGALDAAPAQAFMVPEISLACYQEITLIRKNLEGMAVAAASQRMTEEERAVLAGLCGAFRDAKLAGNVELALQANRTFRFRLYDDARMPTLTSLIEQLWVRIGPCFNYLYPQSTETAQGHHNYDELLEALAAGDSERSVGAIHKAIDDGAEMLMRQYFA